MFINPVFFIELLPIDHLKGLRNEGRNVETFHIVLCLNFYDVHACKARVTVSLSWGFSGSDFRALPQIGPPYQGLSNPAPILK